MFPANTYRIRLAGADDAGALERLEEQASESPLAGRVLIGELHGMPAGALSLADGRAVTDGSPGTDRLVAALRIRAGAMRAYEATPSLAERMRTALRAYRDESIVRPLPGRRGGHEEERLAA